ncbi:MAG: NAD(+) synthase [Acholeplasmataceae bacterium]|nr:MAG: NAD(+) synthase [Acholeplasmataceae bacterium]
MYHQGFLKVEAATPDIVVGDIDHNKQAILRILKETRASMVVFPELSLSGYSASDLFFQESFIEHVLSALKDIIRETSYQGVFILGAPLDVNGILYNCAVVVHHKTILGVVPKHYLPNHHEFYEKRWFNAGFKSTIKQIRLFNQEVPFGHLLFEDEDKHLRFGVEICQDVWATYSPSDDMSLAGANLIFNLSASTEFIGKADFRRHLILDHSRKQMTAYVYTSCGQFESTSEVVFSPHKLIASQGRMLAEDDRFSLESSVLTADLDLMAINYQKRQDSTYRDMHMSHQYKYQTIPFVLDERADFLFEHKVDPLPFLPAKDDVKTIIKANELQVIALLKRIESMPPASQKIVIGVSGGLDSTLALLVAHQAMKRLGRKPEDVIAVTMPAKVTGKKSLATARDLMDALKVTKFEIPIDKMLDVHLDDLEHQEEDVMYENAQARIRTLILMDLANKYGGFVLGTGDMSEIALGWMTYSGDQMSMYAINAGLPKTWIRLLIAHHLEHTYTSIKPLLQTVLEQPVSPELLEAQETETIIGPYDINDFILYHHLVLGGDEARIAWLLTHAYALDIEEAHEHVTRFFTRFYSQQFKRQTLPEGPKILGISLSPRGEYRMPSDVKRK